MANCKDCVRYDACNSYYPRFMKDRLKLGDGYVCDHFRNKANFVEVVHCYECENCKTIMNLLGEPHFFCTKSLNNTEVELKHYCSYGVRKNDNT